MVDAVPTPSKDILVIVFSKTPEKVAHFDHAAENSNVKFIDIHRLVEGYNVAPEDTGERDKNATQKARAVKSTIKKLKTPGTPEHQNLLAQLESLGIAYDENKIFGMVEDSTFTTSPGVWPYLRQKLKGIVSDELLEKYSGKNGHDEPGPGAETGPIVAATGGFLRFYNLLREAYKEALKDLGNLHTDGLIKSQCTAVLFSMAKPNDETRLSSETNSYLLDIGDKEYFPANDNILNPYDYVVMENDRRRPISSYNSQYFFNHSPRALVFKQMQAKVFDAAARVPSAEAPPAFKQAADIVTQRRETPTRHVAYKKSLRERIYDVINFDTEMQKVGKNGIVFDTFDPANYGQKLKALSDFVNFLVAKQLVARDMFKPGVLIDNGCWQGFVKLIHAFSNLGMAKDFTPFANNEGKNGITHTVSSFFDGLHFNPHQYDRANFDPDIFDDAILERGRTKQQETLRNLTQAIVAERSKGYHSFIETSDSHKFEAEGAPPDGSRFTVAHFVSASSDNQVLNEQCRAIGTTAAENGFGYVWGGMNMHSGGEGFKAYVAAGGVHAAAYSTRPIAAAETEDGRLPPEAHYREWSRDIYERIAGMVAASDAIVISPGGWGTLQEMLLVLRLKHEEPELFANKKIIIDNPALFDGNTLSETRFWNDTLQTVLGAYTRNKDFTSTRDKDILISHSSDETAMLLKSLAAERDARLAPQAASLQVAKPGVKVLAS